MEWQFFISFWKTHKSISCSSTWGRHCRPSIGIIIARGGIFAFCKLCILYHNICSVNALPIFICITARLNTPFKNKLSSFAAKSLKKLCRLAKCNTAYEICCLFITVPTESAVNCQRESCNCIGTLSLRVPDLCISC